MLQRNFIQALMATLMIMVFATFVVAQTNQNTQTGNQTTTSNQPSKATAKSSTEQTSKTAVKTNRHMTARGNKATYDALQDLWKENRDLYADWTEINEHYVSMMKITEQDDLRREMSKHQDMINDYNKKYAAYEENWEKSMAQVQPSTERSTASSKTMKHETMHNKTDHNMNMNHELNMNHQTNEPTGK